MQAEYAAPGAAGTSRLGRSRKRRPVREFVCEYVFRPIAHPLVLVLLRLGVRPPSVVLANAAFGLAGAAALVRGHLVVAALLVQVKTVLDNADGQLARLSGRVTVLGRYLDSESDLLVNSALLAAVGVATGRPWLALATFVVLTLVLSAIFNLERLYRAERGDGFDPEPRAEGLAAVLARVYALIYAPHDRLFERLVEWRLRGADDATRLAYHDRRTIAILANLDMSTQLAVLGAFLVAGRPALYCWFVLACGVVVVGLAALRERNKTRGVVVEAGT